METIESLGKNYDPFNAVIEPLMQFARSQEGLEAEGDKAIFSDQALTLLGLPGEADDQAADPAEPLEVYYKEFDTPTAGIYGRQRVASRVEDGSQGEGDTASFSDDAFDVLGTQIAPNDKMTASQVVATLNDGNSNPTVITFNNQNGSITWNGNYIDLSGFANTLKDDVVVKNNDGFIEVYNLTTQQKMTLNGDGTKQKVNGKLDPASIVEDSSEAVNLSTALFINNRGKAASTSDGNDIIINRQAGSVINAGKGDDKIFNYAATASKLDGGGGNDAVYSVGLTSGTSIDVSSEGNGYVKLLGNMTGGNILLGSGQNFVDASGMTLAGVTITDDASAKASAVVAQTISARSKITLNAAQAGVDVSLLQSSSVTFGSGANSLVADKISGTAADKTTITSKGINTYKLGSVAFAKINSSDAASDAIKISGAVSDTQFDLSKGNNLLDASGQTMTTVQITSKEGGNGSTNIIAGSIIGRNAKDGASSILLAGSDSGNTVTVKQNINNTTINTGSGAGTVNAGAVSAVSVLMGGESSTREQVLNIYGAATNLDYKGSNGRDALQIYGALSNSNINLGAGDNSFVARNAKDVLQTVANTNITASGDGATSLTMGNYSYSAAGNTIALGAGANSIGIGQITGSGSNGLRINIASTDATQTLNINGAANYLSYTGSAGADNISVAGAMSNSSIDLGAGDNSFMARNGNNVLQAVSNTNIKASGQSSTSLTMGNYSYGTLGNEIILGAGNNTVT